MDGRIPSVAAPHSDTSSPPAFRLVRPEGQRRFLLVCDHASPALPEGYGTLGLAAEAFGRHIAYDIGAGALTEALAARLDCPAVLARYSRLLIDLNRGLDDPTLIMALSDGAIVAGNHPTSPAERARRVSRYYAPYHDAIAAALDRALRSGVSPLLISVHSFTPIWRGRPRPWHVGVLWNRDDRIARPLLQALRGEGDLVVGDNEPYSGELEGDCMDQHGTRRGLPHVLIEVRQDLIADAAGVEAWADRLARVMGRVAETV